MGTTQQVILITTVTAGAALAQQRFVGADNTPCKAVPQRSGLPKWMLLRRQHAGERSGHYCCRGRGRCQPWCGCSVRCSGQSRAAVRRR